MIVLSFLFISGSYDRRLKMLIKRGYINYLSMFVIEFNIYFILYLIV